MINRSYTAYAITASAIGILAAVAIPAAVRAGGDKIAFPADYAKGVMYMTFDAAANKTYRELYKPFHQQVNDWIHNHTAWKTFIHTDGALMPLLPEFLDAGFDILNPVQFTAKGMDPATLKQKFGDRLVFWGGGVDTQNTLPLGAPDEVRAQVHANMQIFAPGGGFVFSTVHNVQPRTPVENLLAMYETVREYREYTVN